MNHSPNYILITIAFLFLGCGSPDNVYNVKGTIHEIKLDENQVIIAHDSIRNLMDPMIMPFPISKSNKMKNFKKGDSVHFEFLWSEDLIEAKNFKLAGKGHLPSKDNFFDGYYSEKVIGDTLDNATLLDLDSNEISLDDFDENLFISYIFSKCPMPNLCPAIFMKNKILANQFAGHDNIRFLLVSFDYVYDIPSTLKNNYGPSVKNNSNIEILSSTNHIEDVYRLVKQSGGDFWGVDNNKIGHKLSSVLVGPNKEILGMWKGEKWIASQVANSISMLLK